MLLVTGRCVKGTKPSCCGTGPFMAHLDSEKNLKSTQIAAGQSEEIYSHFIHASVIQRSHSAATFSPQNYLSDSRHWLGSFCVVVTTSPGRFSRDSKSNRRCGHMRASQHLIALVIMVALFALTPASAQVE